MVSRQDSGQSPAIQASSEARARDSARALGRYSAPWYTEEHPGPGWIEGEGMKRYAVVIEQGPDNLSAYVPDLSGCVTTGKTVEEIERNVREAIGFHLEGMREDGEPIPEPTTVALEIEAPFAA